MSLVFSQSFKNYIFKCDNTICQHLYRYINYEQHTELFTEGSINYITFRTNGTISYLPKGKTHVCNEDDSSIWKRDNRQEGSSSKVIRKIMTKEGLAYFKDSDFETFTNCYKSEFNDEGLAFVLKENIDIPSVYATETLAEGQGTLNGSCMNDCGSNMFAIYKNCKDLRILCLYNTEDELCGRALVWKLSEDITFMDRIYIVKDFYIEKFIKYSEENGWIRKEKQSYDYKDSFVGTDGKTFFKNFTIKLNTDFDRFPYIDTFTYGSDGWLSNDACDSDYEYTNTSGHREGGSHAAAYDDINGCDIDDEDDVCTIDRGQYSGYTTHRDYTVFINDNYWWSESSDIVCVSGDWYEKDDEDIRFCDKDDVYYMAGEVMSIDMGEYNGQSLHEVYVISDVNGESWYRDDSGIVDIDGEYYNKESEEIAYINNEWYLISSDEYQEILNGELTN